MFVVGGTFWSVHNSAVDNSPRSSLSLSHSWMSQALRLKPEYPRVLLRKGRLHARLDQWELAIEVSSRLAGGRLPAGESKLYWQAACDAET